MKRRMAVLVAVTAVSGVLVMFTPTGTTAQAALHDACVAESGTFQLASPFHYPGFRSTTGLTTSAFHIHPHSTLFTVSFDLAQCVNGASLHVSGEVHGWCGGFFGSGVVHPSPLNNPSFHLVGVGGMLVLTGRTSGVLTVVPDTSAGESCASGADNFVVTTSALVMASCTPTVTMTSSSIASISMGSLSVITPTQTVPDFHFSGHLHPRKTICIPNP